MLDHGSNSEKRFSKWPPAAILKNLYICQYVLPQLANFDDQNVQLEGFQSAESMERVLLLPEVRIMLNSKWPPFLLQQIIFLFISWFIIDTGSPWTRIGHHAPPPLSILIRGFLGMLLEMLRWIIWGHDMGFGHLFKWPPCKSNLVTSNWHRIIIFVSTHMFSG